MKKSTFSLLLCLLMGMTMAFISCEKPEPEPDPIPVPEPVQPTNDDPDPEPVVEYSILGHWKMVSAFQVTPNNQADITNMYGTNFQLIFEEDGTLITTDGIHSVEMRWTLNGNQLAFIQAEGMEPVLYTVLNLTSDSLSIENGTGTDIVTTMDFIRQ